MKKLKSLLFKKDTEFGQVTIDIGYNLYIDEVYQGGFGNKKYEIRKAEGVTFKTACVIGLGCGFAVEALVNKGVKVTVIEQNKEVIEIAKNIYGFNSECTLVSESWNGSDYGCEIVLDHRYS